MYLNTVNAALSSILSIVTQVIILFLVQTIKPEKEYTSATLPVAVKFTRRVLISKLTGELTRVRNRINVHGKAARGALPVRMNLQDIFESTLELSLSSALIVKGRFQDQTIFHFTWNATDGYGDSSYVVVAR